MHRDAHSFPRWNWQQILLANVAVLATYLLTRLFAEALAFPAGTALLLFPPAGVGLALVTTGGARVLPGVGLGVLLSNALQPGTSLLATSALLLAALLQAELGAQLLRRLLCPALDSARDLLAFVLLAPLICLICATLAVPALAMLGVLPAAQLWPQWCMWWLGDILGVLLFAPLCWLAFGERTRLAAQLAERADRLHERTTRLEAILDHAADAILTVDASGKLVSANSATARLFGYSAQQLIGLPFSALIPGIKDTAAQLARLARAPAEQCVLAGQNGQDQRMPLSISVAPVELGHEVFYVCIVRDLTEQQRAQERIYRLAHHDALTGLENRFALNIRLEQQLARARRHGEPVAVLFIDLDHFKKINDTLGHAAGDKLLVCAAQRMGDLLREVDTLARLGGDEFIIVLAGPLSPDSASAIALRVVESLARPYLLGGVTVHSGCSVGIALFPEDGDDAATLLRHADMAMYAAKREGRANFQFFSPAMNAATHEHLLLENRMWEALNNGGFSLALQAQVALASGQLTGAEVLLRWTDAELGSVEPSRFIPVAEESGLIVPLGEWVLSQSMALLAQWQRSGHAHLRLAVNLSARQFAGAPLLERLDQLIAEHGIDPTGMELEITETAAMRDPEVTRRLLHQLRARGFSLAIDDFGNGYSSLAYLKMFAIDRIKIDRGFVQDIERNPNDAVIVAATISLGHALGLQVLAEGVETAAQRDFLREKHADGAQGYLFARPMPPAAFADWMRQQAPPTHP